MMTTVGERPTGSLIVASEAPQRNARPVITPGIPVQCEEFFKSGWRSGHSAGTFALGRTPAHHKRGNLAEATGMGASVVGRSQEWDRIQTDTTGREDTAPLIG